MKEQAESARQITDSAESMRVQTEQLAKAMTEQTRSIKDMSSGAQNVARQINLITLANREHSLASAAVLTGLSDIRQITERNAQTVKDTQRATGSLLDRAQSLNAIVDGLTGNGRSGKKARNKKKDKK
jgi:methyl-accepting chemotaxis protein